jgi:hypothetical protein
MFLFISISLSLFVILSAITGYMAAVTDVFVDDMEDDPDPLLPEHIPVWAGYYFGHLLTHPWNLPTIMVETYDEWKVMRSVQNIDHTDPEEVEKLLQRARELLAEEE